MKAYHAVVWLDHGEARVFFFNRHQVEEIDLAATNPHAHLHHRAGTISGHRSPQDQKFLQHVVEALKPAQEWLIMGPGTAKLELVKHVHSHDPTLGDRIIGVETADHPTDRQIVAHAREYFKAADRMRPQV
ncbi:MAG: translational machinery protein [Hyphomicrobiaceae bacterium]